MDLYRYITENSGELRAEKFVGSIERYCDSLRTFPERGTRRDDLISGLRTIGYRRQATIAFSIESDEVVIQGIFYGGQDFEAALRDED